MLQRKYLFPHVIELNYQAGRRLGVNVYLIDGGSEFLLIDVGYLDTVTEIVDLIRQMDYNLSTCKMLIATHADADHIQGIARAKELLKAKVAAHPLSVEPLESGDKIMTYASIKAQVPVVPMAIVGTFEALPMNTYHIQPRELLLIVGDPISPAGYTTRNLDALATKAQRAIEDIYYANAHVPDPRGTESSDRAM